MEGCGAAVVFYLLCPITTPKSPQLKLLRYDISCDQWGNPRPRGEQPR